LVVGPIFLSLSLMSGFLLLDFCVRLWAPHGSGVALVSVLVVLVAWRMKERYWLAIDSTSAPSTVASATLLGNRGEVRMLEPPHSGQTYLLKETSFRIARHP